MRILIVDDEFVALTKMVAILSDYGECECATNGRQAFEMYSEAVIQGQYFDLIVVDINMPELNGLGLLERISLDERSLKLPTMRKIIVSAASNATNVLKAGDFSCDAFLVKPVRRDALCAKLVEMGLEPRPKP